LHDAALMLRNHLLAALAASIAASGILAVACHGNDPAKGGAGSASSASQTIPSAIASAGGKQPGGVQVAEVKPPDIKPDTKGASAPSAPPPPGGHDFTPEAKALLAVGACGDLAPPPSFDPKMLTGHCEIIKKAQDDYLSQWVRPAHSFFVEHVPSDVPRKVVYPFAGGDLSTALTVYPDADEITTISLEPAGDPRDLGELKGAELDRALKQVEYELKFLYRVNFSNTINMIDAMREGSLPTQLIFGLSALKIHGFEVVGLRYFRLEADGSIHYLDDAEVAAVPVPSKARATVRNRVFANAEIQFRRTGGRVQVYRHIQWNLDNEHLKSDPRILKHLEAKGTIAGMTKAASYLLSWDSFSTMRDYLIGHVSWMVSDATGVAPKWGKPAGFEYETYGEFTGPHIQAGGSIAKDWRVEFESEPKRELAFRFGYYDKHNANHLIIMRKKKA
jgi:hypothetical protein